MLIIEEEHPRKQPPAGQQWYAVDVSFTRKGTFEVMAENEEAARKIVEEKCWTSASHIVCEIPLDAVAWNFPVLSKKEIGNIEQVVED